MIQAIIVICADFRVKQRCTEGSHLVECCIKELTIFAGCYPQTTKPFTGSSIQLVIFSDKIAILVQCNGFFICIIDPTDKMPLV